MKRGLKIAVVTGIAGMAFQCIVPAADAAALTNQHEKVSYGVGMYIANSFLKRNGLDVDLDIMADGIKDVMAGRELKLSDQEAQQTLAAYQQELREKREQERNALAEKNRADGEAFFAVNREKPDVKSHQVKLPNDATAELQYKVLSEGEGESPTPNANIAYRIRGTTIDGKEFENTTAQPEPVRVPFSRVQVPGLREALQMMKPGSRWQVYVPSSLGYGDFPGPNVEPGSSLIYDLELVSVEAPQPLTSDIIRVPSAEELARGDKIEVIKAEDLKRMMQTNAPAVR